MKYLSKTKHTFNQWNTQKIDIHLHFQRKSVRRGEVWIMQLGNNIGSEQNKKRPCIILNNPKIYENTCIIIPASKKIKYSSYQIEDFFFLLHQIKVVDTKRCLRKIHTIKQKQLHDLERSFIQFIHK